MSRLSDFVKERDQYFCSWTQYIRFGTCNEVNIIQLCFFCTMYEKCEFLSMGCISALTQASMLIREKGFKKNQLLRLQIAQYSY